MLTARIWLMHQGNILLLILFFIVITFLLDTTDTVRRLKLSGSLSIYLTGYGMTECTTISHMTPSVDSKHGSIGVLLPNLECKVR